MLNARDSERRVGMFGSNDKNQPDNSQQSNNTPSPNVPVASPPQDALATSPPDPVIAPTAPPLNDTLSPASEESTLPSPAEMPTIVTDSAKAKDSASEPPLSSSLPPNTADDELVNIKQQALGSLAPLVDQLDQTPEEKFKTTMMLIQASDNAALIKDAYDAANAIPDEKVRAQALLDVVNEINYFTQHKEQ